MQRMTAALANILLLAAGMAHSADQTRTLTVFAAASVTDVLQAVGDEFTRQTRTPVRFSFAASSALARQIESGAAADVFVSADQEWMDYLDSKQLIDSTTRRNILTNRLALVAPADSTIALKIAPGFGLVAALGTNGRLATGDPDSVPVGKYAKASLTTLGVWKQVEPRLVRAENVRAALAFIARGEVPLGIVYATDASVEPKVRVVDLFPESTHPPITYPAAATKIASPQARAFVEFLGSPTAEAIYERAGFRTFTQPR
jgi:molybdate transport system substrate-binding protein